MSRHRLPLAVLFLVALAGSACGSAEAVPKQTTIDPAQPGAWFVNTGCTSCHPVSVYGHRNPAATGPDLSLAVEDVPRRFGRPLDEFLREPVGTMRLVLADRIQMTPTEREVAIRQLERAYQDYLRLRAVSAVASH